MPDREATTMRFTRVRYVRSCCIRAATTCKDCPSHRGACPPSGPPRLQWRTSFSRAGLESNVAKHVSVRHDSRSVEPNARRVPDGDVSMKHLPGASGLKEEAKGSGRARCCRGSNSASLPRGLKPDYTGSQPARVRHLRPQVDGPIGIAAAAECQGERLQYPLAQVKRLVADVDRSGATD